MNAVPFELDVQMFLRLLNAVVLGALVGYERERAGKPTGVRTHGMFRLGAALFAVVSIHGFGGTVGSSARCGADRDRYRLSQRRRHPAPAQLWSWFDDRCQPIYG